MKSNAFGLDIGTAGIKLVWLDNEKNGFVYNTSLLGVAPRQGMQSESPFDQQEMAQLINKFVIDAKIGTNNVNVSLPENQVFTKVIDMPALSDKEVSDAIYWEAEQYIPAPLDTVTLDWSVLRRPKTSGLDARMQVLLVAAPIALVKRYQSILELAGLTVMSVEPEILSTIRGIWGKGQSPTCLLINIGSMNTSFAIVQNGVIIFNYIIALGGVAFTRAITADFGFTFPQAEEYKRTYGLSDKNFGGKIARAIEPILTSIATEIKKAIAFYATKYKGESAISQIVLTGGSALLPGIELYFADQIGIETVIGNPWSMLSIANVPKEVLARGPEYTVSVGLALKEYEQ
ncbi:MAG: type IV pilus assembly protein PilM [Patescibacteria group bacterium]